MNKLKRKLSLAMAIVTLLTAMLVMVSCNNNNNGDGSSSTTTTAPTPPAGAAGSLVLAEGDKTTTKIVLKIASNAYINEAVELLEKKVADSIGATIGKDYDEMHKPADGVVVLVGETQYAESASAMSALESNSYSISVVDNKIIVVASNSYLYPIAMKKLIENISVADGAVSIAKDYSFKSESYVALSISANDYRIVYANGNETAKSAANVVKLGLQDAGFNVQIAADNTPASGKEILVGSTNRSLSQYEANKDYKCGIIKKDDNGNIALTGNCTASAERFAKYAKSLAKDGKGLDLIDPMFGVFAPEGMGWAPNYTGGGTLEVKDSFEMSGSYYLLIHNATEKDYTAYLEVLKGAGFECYHSVKSNGQLFSTYTDGYNILTLSQISYNDPRTNNDRIYDTPSNGDVSYMTIGVDCIENSALPERNAEIEDITTEQITTINTICGYVLRLRDGRFVIFDGGQTEAHAKTTYEIITAQNVREGKPVIAAWFLTHGHSDHINGLRSFIAKYSKDVIVENFVHNLPAYEQYNGKNVVEIDPPKESKGLYDRSVAYYNDIEKYYPKANIIVARAGQRFEYGTLAIDVLFTCENLYKKQMLDTNASSVVYSITGDTGRMLILGDLVDPEGGVLNAVYEDELDCDLVQVAHHGYNNGNIEMYNSMNAEYAIWTNSKEAIIQNKSHLGSRNQFDYKSVYANLIPSTKGPAITLTEGMTKAQITALDVGLTG